MIKRYAFPELPEHKDGMFVKWEDYARIDKIAGELYDLAANLDDYAVHNTTCNVYENSDLINKCNCKLANYRKIFREYKRA